MKLAVLSDIHSNYIALEACIEHMEKENIDGIIFLGDYVSDCPDPQVTLKLMKNLQKKYTSWVIRGNREEYFINHADGMTDDWSYSSYNGSLLYTYEHLTPEDINMFRNYPNKLVVDMEGTQSITIVHGSPGSSKELLYTDGENTKQYLKNLETDYLLCGHTHKQLEYQYQGKTLWNPGSVGVAIGGHAVADYAILEWDHEEWNCQFYSVPYDYQQLKQIFMDSELMEKANIWPRCILQSIDSGINVGPICAKMAFDLATKENVRIENRIVPEKYWIKAARMLNIFTVSNGKEDDFNYEE